MKRLLLFAVTLISLSAVGQELTTLPAGSVQVQSYKLLDGRTVVGNAVKKFPVMAYQGKVDSLFNAINTALTGKVDKTTTVNGHSLSGNVTVTKGDVGLGNVDNTSDAAKPISTATQTALDGKQGSLGFTPENLANKAVAGGYASLDGSGRVPLAQLPTGTQTYIGTWNASTNTPTLADGVGTLGQYYIVNAPGTQNLGSGSVTYALGDNVIYNGSIWEKVANSGGVTSVNGMTGAVSLTTANIPESGNLYYTEARVSVNTNVAANTAARHPAVTLGTENGLSLSTQSLSLGLASTSTTGALSSTDWNTFNGKQPAGSYQAQLNGTGFVKASGTTISYDNSTYLTTSAAASTYEPIFSKNTGFNKNFGTALGTVAQGNDSRINNGQTAFGWGNHAGLYPTYTGAGATGTWGIGISGNAATATLAANSTGWNSLPRTADGINDPGYIVTMNTAGDNAGYTNKAQLKNWLDLAPSGGETLQSVTDRGNIIESSIPTLRLKTNQGSGKEFRLSAGYFDSSSLSIIDVTAGNIDRLHISSAGNVGIGTTTPSAKLDVNGTGNFSGDVTAPKFRPAIGGAWTAGTGELFNSTADGLSLSLPEGTTNDFMMMNVNGEEIMKVATGDVTVDIPSIKTLTASPGDNSTKVATTAFVQAAAITAANTRPISVKTANYTLTTTDYTVITGTNSITFTLPDASLFPGRTFQTVNMSSGSITINCATGSQIKWNMTTFTTPTNSVTGSYYKSHWQSDGTYWFLVGE